MQSSAIYASPSLGGLLLRNVHDLALIRRPAQAPKPGPSRNLAVHTGGRDLVHQPPVVVSPNLENVSGVLGCCCCCCCVFSGVFSDDGQELARRRWLEGDSPVELEGVGRRLAPFALGQLERLHERPQLVACRECGSACVGITGVFVWITLQMLVGEERQAAQRLLSLVYV